jgi:hypothetical protein
MIAEAALMVALMAGPATPPAPAKDASAGAFTPEERAQALEALKAIADKFGVQQPAPAPAAQPAQPPGKTMADVADKALDISTKYIGQAASIIEKAAPRVWAIMIRQQYAKAIGNTLAPFLWIIMIIAVTAVARHFWHFQVDPPPHNCRVDRCVGCTGDEEQTAQIIVTLIIPIAATIIAGGFFIYSLAESSMYLVNPEYYAIKDLVQILLHPGTL